MRPVGTGKISRYILDRYTEEVLPKNSDELKIRHSKAYIVTAEN